MNCGLIAKIAIIVAVQVGFLLGLPKDVDRVNEDTAEDLAAHYPASQAAQLSVSLTDINRLSTSPIDDPAVLWALQLELLAIAEALFGPRDASFQLYQPQFFVEGPNVRFSVDQEGVWAELSYNGRKYWPAVVYEMAHETVHLLDPVVGNANNLEEGVAVAFSLHAQTLYGVDVQVPSIPSYVYALKLVDKLPGDILSDVALIRRELGPLSHVTLDGLRGLFPNLDAHLANELTHKFERDAVPPDSDTAS